MKPNQEQRLFIMISAAVICLSPNRSTVVAFAITAVCLICTIWAIADDEKKGPK